MSKSYKLLISAILFSITATSSPALATPYTGADIELDGTAFSSIDGNTLYNDLAGKSYVWGKTGDNVYTNWGNLWIEYSASLTPGNWNIGLNAINYGDTLGPSGWYQFFDISSNLNGSNISNANKLLYIPASASEVNYDYFNIDIDTAGDYTVKYYWTNDKYIDSEQDANIEIISAFFDNTTTGSPVPEPTSMLLFGTGLIVLAVFKRKYVTVQQHSRFSSLSGITLNSYNITIKAD